MPLNRKNFRANNFYTFPRGFNNSAPKNLSKHSRLKHSHKLIDERQKKSSTYIYPDNLKDRHV